MSGVWTRTPNAPQGVTGNRWIEVNLAEQTVSVYDKNQLIFATMASTGVDHSGRCPGLFQIQKKLDATTMSNSVQDDFYYLEGCPLDDVLHEGRALHGAFTGITNLAIASAMAASTFRPAMPTGSIIGPVWGIVTFMDPSGQTPTDPSLFGPVRLGRLKLAYGIFSPLLDPWCSAKQVPCQGRDREFASRRSVASDVV